jgi:hypothetical protein
MAKAFVAKAEAFALLIYRGVKRDFLFVTYSRFTFVTYRGTRPNLTALSRNIPSVQLLIASAR